MRLALAFVLVACSCGGSSGPAPAPEQPTPLPSPSVAAADAGPSEDESYKGNARTFLEHADAVRARGDLEKAGAMYREIQRLYPYSRIAERAEMNAADVLADQHRWAEAARAYDEFVRNHVDPALVAQAKTKALDARKHLLE